MSIRVAVHVVIAGAWLSFTSCRAGEPPPTTQPQSTVTVSTTMDGDATTVASGTSDPDALNSPMKAKRATSLRFNCDSERSPRILSPDETIAMSVACRPNGDGDRSLLLHILRQGRRTQEIVLAEGSHELLWADDSRAFFVNGGFNAYSGDFIAVYQVHPDGIAAVDVTRAAQRDMVLRFPPCKAAFRDETTCAATERNPDFNVSGIDWISGSASMILFAEVPCTSIFGGIMCQVQGYEVDVPSGRILRRMSAREFKEQWQYRAAWDVRVPESPEYGEPWNSR